MEINEFRYGKWWAVDYWLVRIRNTYDDMQNQQKTFEELFAELRDEWEKQSIQLRQILKQELK